MAALEHPFKTEIQALRATIRTSHKSIEERVKWKAPSYHVGGVDLAAFNLHQQKFVQLVMLFPKGFVDDPAGILEGAYKDRRLVHFHDAAEVKKKSAALKKVLKALVSLHRNPIGR